MDNQGITAEQARMMQMQAAQQSGGLSGLGGSGLFGGIAAGFGGAFLSPSFSGLPSRQSARLSNQRLMSQLCEAGTAEPSRKRSYKVRDYSENLIQKEEKILPIERR